MAAAVLDISRLVQLRADMVRNTAQILSEGFNFLETDQGGINMKVMLIDFNSNLDENKTIGLSIGEGQFQANFTFTSDLLKSTYS